MVCAGIVAIPQSGTSGIGRPNSLGLLLVGSRQDASQIGGSGLGLGVEVFLRYRLTSRVSLAGATGVFTVTDDILRTENRKTVFLPSLELRGEYDFIRGEWFRPFVYLGFHFVGASTRDEASRSYAYEGNFVSGLGARFRFDGWPNTLYLSGDCRSGLLSSEDPKPLYWVAKIGVCFPFANRDLVRGGGVVPADLWEEEPWRLSPDEKSAVLPVAETSPESKTLIERIDELEEYVLRNSQNILNVLGRCDSLEAHRFGVSRMKGDREKAHAGVSSVEKKYQLGLKKFKAGEYDEAMQIFEGLLKNHPEHVLCGNFHYWIGECYYALGKCRETIAEMDSVFACSSSHKYDDALLKKGQCYVHLGQEEEAAAQFRELLSRFPDSEYVSRAKKYLDNL